MWRTSRLCGLHNALADAALIRPCSWVQPRPRVMTALRRIVMAGANVQVPSQPLRQTAWRTCVALNSANQIGRPDSAKLAEGCAEQAAQSRPRWRNQGGHPLLSKRKTERGFKRRGATSLRSHVLPEAVMDPEEESSGATDPRHRRGTGATEAMRLARKQCTLYERKQADAEAAETTRLREFNEEHGEEQHTNVVAVGRTGRVVGEPVRTPWRDGKTTGAHLTCEWKHDQLPVRSGRMVGRLPQVHRTYTLSTDTAWRRGIHIDRLLVCGCVCPVTGRERTATHKQVHGNHESSLYEEESCLLICSGVQRLDVVVQGRAHDVGGTFLMRTSHHMS